MSIFKKIFSSDPVAELQPFVEQINALEPEFEKKPRDELRQLTNQWKEEVSNLTPTLSGSGEGNDVESRREYQKVLHQKLDEILPQAFAAVREAAKRTLGQRHFDVQLVGGIVLHRGKIAEMKTGEGKTLAATTSVYLNALASKGVHVVTVNDYLARRDASWMGQIYDYLGLTVGAIQHERSFKYQVALDPSRPSSSVPRRGTAADKSGTPGSSPGQALPSPAPTVSSGLGEGEIATEATRVELDVKNLVPATRQEAYRCDVTYGTNNEFGFDYLRDNMVLDLSQKVQRDIHYAIVDEVDSILIDEARTPLIISAPDTEPTDKYYQFAKMVENLEESGDYNVDEKKKSATLTETGIAKLEKMLGIENIYVEKGIATVHHIEQALRAKTLFKKDRDYVVRPSTHSTDAEGRPERASRGATGSGQEEIVIVDEFTGRLLPGRRYSEGLHQAIEAKEGVEVQRESKTLATITFQNYFRLYSKLAGMTGTAMTEAEEFQKIYGLEPFEIPTHRPMIRADAPDGVFKTEQGKLTAIVAAVKERYEKGQPVLIGTVSIEKNERLSEVLAKAGIQHELLNAKNHEQEAKIIAQAGRAKAVTLATNIAGRGVDIILGGVPYDEAKANEVRVLGGLHVLGTERHEARRIDNQLRGRSGRQGDPGSSQFCVSLEDDLIRLFGGDRVAKMMDTLGIPEDMPIEHNLVSKVIESAQKKIEGLNFDLRKHVLEFDDVMNKHREVIYRIRNRLLRPGLNLKEEILQKIETEIANVVSLHTAANDPSEWNKKEILETIKSILPAGIDENSPISPSFAPHPTLSPEGRGIKGEGKGGQGEFLGEFNTREEIIEHYTDLAHQAYEAKEKHLASEVMRQVEKVVMLQSIDSLWMEHLDTMDHLRDSVRLRGYAQRDPLIEYKREGFDMFQRLLAEIDKAIVYTIYKVELRTAPSAHQPLPVQTSGASPEGRKIGRNVPCPCGAVNPNTGKVYKYKNCGLINAPHHKK